MILISVTPKVYIANKSDTDQIVFWDEHEASRHTADFCISVFKYGTAGLLASPIVTNKIGIHIWVGDPFCFYLCVCKYFSIFKLLLEVDI